MHIGMRPKGGTFGLGCKGTRGIEGPFCFGYMRTEAIFMHQLSAIAPPTYNNAQNSSVAGAQSTMESPPSSRRTYDNTPPHRSSPRHHASLHLSRRTSP
ncbi:hypothetical protein DEO72_LG9g1592 [Vigna unguiculata]|uniref:Uncharacterized protein n=1 Tax=Vigna unguiculata TaxID=3917 RepID=A0A4D6MZW2_VIGUN|nr:hypothetical protein DEO72_LG9g1592 [Vigna unguiculata]